MSDKLQFVVLHERNLVRNAATDDTENENHFVLESTSKEKLAPSGALRLHESTGTERRQTEVYRTWWVLRSTQNSERLASQHGHTRQHPYRHYQDDSARDSSSNN